MKEHYGLIGYPLEHSFSARFFSEKFEQEGIAAIYKNYEILRAEQLLDIIQDPQLRGLNVTIPYKQSVLPMLDRISEEAKAIGAVNVIRVSHDADGVHLYGYNSDVVGFSRSITPLLNPSHKQALILGTGGASKAVVYGLQQLGIASTFVSRSKKSGQLTYEELSPAIMAAHTVIVNCSPVGMFPHIDEAPAIPYASLTPQHLLYDLVYNPEQTQFMTRGSARGAMVKNGLEMLHIQALVAWDFWHER
ncbi:shikimate dehydrogenase family protein [Alloprevotella rava]|uniref:Shikimate dehydrogenase n=1 Tax=Alloprevotella rava TaxID=671218 RepID=A0A7W5UEL6_9BACT|nr:shikimate dehydrogenase [Alloprevotella rava]MBB3702689.1 shikimate dehydrogenase [Alloprevotella rava]